MICGMHSDTLNCYAHSYFHFFIQFKSTQIDHPFLNSKYVTIDGAFSAKGRVWSKGHAIVPAVSHRPVTADAWVCTWVSPCGICVDKVALGQVFL
jgi:hypothetical protein